MIGFNDIKTANGVFFYVTRNTPYSSNGTVIPYETEQLNIGGAMDLATGVFTSPVNGRYQFIFTALAAKGNERSDLVLRVNGAGIGRSVAPSHHYTLPIVATLQLKKGDTIDMFLQRGSIEDTTGHYTHFSGILLQEDLVL